MKSQAGHKIPGIKNPGQRAIFSNIRNYCSLTPFSIEQNVSHSKNKFLGYVPGELIVRNHFKYMNKLRKEFPSCLAGLD